VSHINTASKWPQNSQHTVCYLYRSLSYQVHILTSSSFCLHFNIIIPSRSNFPKRSLPFLTKIFQATNLSNECYMPSPSHLPWLHRPINIQSWTQIMKLLVMQFSPASRYFHSLRSTHYPQHPNRWVSRLLRPNSAGSTVRLKYLSRQITSSEGNLPVWQFWFPAYVGNRIY
jgi:hypothetical protein